MRKLKLNTGMQKPALRLKNLLTVLTRTAHVSSERRFLWSHNYSNCMQ